MHSAIPRTLIPEMRGLSSGKAVTQFNIATNEYIGQGKEMAEVRPVVTWDRLAEIAGTYLGKASRSPSRVGCRPARGTTTVACIVVKCHARTSSPTPHDSTEE